jgi:hypothetical protein
VSGRRSADRPSDKLPASVNGLPRWIIFVGVGVPAALTAFEALLDREFFYTLLGIPALLLVWAIAALCSALWCALFAYRRAWKQLPLAAILPAVLLLVAPDPTRFVRSCDYYGDALRFIATRSYYDRKVAALPRDQLRFAVFDWGGMVWAGHELVYDESDQITLRWGQQSAPWLSRARKTELVCGYGVQPLWAHYYMADTPC